MDRPNRNVSKVLKVARLVPRDLLFIDSYGTYGRKEEANAAISRRTRFVFFPITRGKRVYFIIIGPAPDYNREGPSRDEGSRRVIAVGRGLLFGGIRCLETVR